MDGQHFYPDNSGYAEKRVQSYDFFSYLANFQILSFFFLAVFLFSLLLSLNFSQISQISQIYFVTLHSKSIYCIKYEGKK